MAIIKNTLPDSYFSDKSHRDDIDERISDIFKSCGYGPDLKFFWSLGGDLYVDIKTRQGYIDMLAGQIVEGLSAEHIVLEYSGTRSFAQAKKEVTSRLVDALDSVRSTLVLVRSMKKSEII